MGMTGIFALVGVVLRVIQEAPDMIDAAEGFWNRIAETQGVHPTVDSAVQAAITKARNGGKA